MMGTGSIRYFSFGCFGHFSVFFWLLNFRVIGSRQLLCQVPSRERENNIPFWSQQNPAHTRVDDFPVSLPPQICGDDMFSRFLEDKLLSGMIPTDLVWSCRFVSVDLWGFSSWVKTFFQVLLERSWAEEKATLEKETRRENISPSSFNHTSVEHGVSFTIKTWVPSQIILKHS